MGMVAENGHPDSTVQGPEEAPFRGLTNLDAEVLIDFVTRQPTLPELAQKRGLSLLAFPEWWNSPAVAAALEAMLRVQALRRDLRNEELRAELVAILAQVARTSTSPVEQRRAATTALRATDPRATGHAAYRSSRPSSRYPRLGDASNLEFTHAGGRTTGASPSHRRRPRRIADFNLGPQEAERFLERERRENDRLEKLIHRVVAASDSLDHDGAFAPEERAAVAGGAASHSDASPRASPPTDLSAPEGRAGIDGSQPGFARSPSSPRGGFKGGVAPIECTGQGAEAAGGEGPTPSTSDPEHEARTTPAYDEDALDFARRILCAVETNSPEAAHFTPEDIETARYYTSIFDRPPAAAADARPP